MSPTSVPGEQDYKEVKKEVVVCQIHFQYSVADLDQVWISLSVNEKGGVNCVDTINSMLCKQAAFLNRTFKKRHKQTHKLHWLWKLAVYSFTSGKTFQLVHLSFSKMEYFSTACSYDIIDFTLTWRCFCIWSQKLHAQHHRMYGWNTVEKNSRVWK